MTDELADRLEAHADRLQCNADNLDGDFDPNEPNADTYRREVIIGREHAAACRLAAQRLRGSGRPGAEAVARAICTTFGKNPDHWLTASADNRRQWERYIPHAQAVLALFPPEGGCPEGWWPTHRHVKRGTEYEYLGWGRAQCSESGLLDDEHVAIYRGEDGSLWARRLAEFNDGRFEPLAAAPSPSPTRRGFVP